MSNPEIPFSRRNFLLYATATSAALLTADNPATQKDRTPQVDIAEVIANPSQFQNQILWVEGYYETQQIPYSGTITRKSTPFTIGGGTIYYGCV
ncbi:hypothetical protein BH11PAT1_BH11PAT1_6320 [soil metagenome]